MNNIFQNLLFLLSIYATACYVLTFITRRIVETAASSLKVKVDKDGQPLPYASKMAQWWNEVILYSIAPFFGVVLALSFSGTDYFPKELRGSKMVAVMTGLVCGFTCGWFFKIFKRILSQASKMEEKELDETPSTPDVPGGK